jgi:hypothetical protein
VAGTVKQSEWVRRVPAALAILSFVVLCVAVLSQKPKMIEPDPFAYRASIEALADGNVTLTQAQYDQLISKLMKTDVGGGIMQWVHQPDGQWISEKNPGYPYLVMPFKKLGLLRLASLFYGMLGCLGLWFGARRWLGNWGAAFAVSAFCSSSAAMFFAWRETMPTFTETALIAAGVGALIWTVLAVERSERARIVTGSLAFSAFGLATFSRYTILLVLVIAGGFAAAACYSSNWNLPRRALAVWAAVAAVPLLCIVAFNVIYYGGPLKTGYLDGVVKFSVSALPVNLRELPLRLIQQMPVFVLGLAAAGLLIWTQWQFRASNAAANKIASEGNQNTKLQKSLRADRWVGVFLVGIWFSTWGLYFMWEWQGQMIERATEMGIGDYTYTRYFVPALSSIALMTAWLLIRLPQAVALGILGLLLVFGIADFIVVANSSWANRSWFQPYVPRFPGQEK